MTEKQQSIHIFRANEQPATKYKIPGLNFWMRNKPMQVFRCLKCKKRRRAKNLVVQAYYDDCRFFCKGGCK